MGEVFATCNRTLISIQYKKQIETSKTDPTTLTNGQTTERKKYKRTSIV